MRIKNQPTICIIGAGSAQFTLDLIRDLCLTESLAGSTVWLVGHVNREKVEQVHAVGTRYSEEKDAGLVFKVTYDRREALKGADFVINTAAAKPNTPLRQLLFFMEIVRDMEELCPTAWLLMAANPVFEGCTLINRQSTIKVVGLCHGFREGVRNIAEVLGFDPAEVHAQVAGLNHNVWLTHLFHNGKNIYPILDEWIEKKSATYWKSPAFNGGKIEWGNMSPKAVQMYSFFGLIPIGDTAGHSSPWWYLTDGDTQRKYMFIVKEWAEVYTDHINAKMEAIQQAAADPSAPVSKFIPAVKSTGHDHINIIEAIVNDNPREFVVNIPNNGAIDGIPDDVVVEIPAVVSGRGIQGLRVGRLPEPITLYLKSAVVRMEYLLSAYLSGSRNILTASYLNDPCSITSMIQGEPWLIGSLEEALKRTDDLLASDEKLAAHFSAFE